MNKIIRVLKYRFNLDEDKAKEEEIISSISRNVEFRGTNLWGLIFAIFIASIGLNVNSTAVVIGAMLISPLMGPIIGLGLGAGTFDLKFIRYALKNLFVAAAISILTSAVYFYLSPIKEPQSELIARTAPTIWDVLIALFGGLAGIVASTRKNISNTIPGVAIATALMPPLCTAGFGIARGDFMFFAGAFYLFIINSVFIAVSAFLIVRFLKFKPAPLANPLYEKTIRRYVWLIAILTILPSLFLAYRFVEKELFMQKVEKFVESEVTGQNLIVISKHLDPVRKNISMVVYSDSMIENLQARLNVAKDGFGLENSSLRVMQTQGNSLGRQDWDSLRKGLTSEFGKQTALLMERNRTISKLQEQVHNSSKKDTTFEKELNMLFGPLQEFAVVPAPLIIPDVSADTTLLVYLKKPKRSKGPDVKKLREWLQIRHPGQKVRIIVD